MGEGDEPAFGLPCRELDELLGPSVDLRRCLAAGTAVLVDLPVGVRLVNLLRGQAFVATVVDLSQQWRDARLVEAGELGRASGPLERARVHGVERDAGEPATDGCGLLFAARGEGQVGDAGVLTREAPLGLAVTGEVDLERQAGLPIISGRPERRERLALSITAPARTR